MPKEAFGGDDSGGGGASPDKRKLVLDRFGLSPDSNIRDVFWKLMASYAATKKPDAELKAHEHDRFALMRVAVSVLANRESEHYGLAPKFIAQYTVMMMVDGGWNDALAELMEAAAEKKLGIGKELSSAMKRLLAQDRYGAALTELLSSMVRNRRSGTVALGYIADMESPELVRAMKKELIIIARGDIGQNQMNAIKAIAALRDDEEVRKSLVILLSHWDAQARLAAAEVLAQSPAEEETVAAARKRLDIETDEDVKKLLRKIAGDS